MQPFFPAPERTQTSDGLGQDIRPRRPLKLLDIDAVGVFDRWDDAGDVDHRDRQ